MNKTYGRIFKSVGLVVLTIALPMGAATADEAAPAVSWESVMAVRNDFRSSRMTWRRLSTDSGNPKFDEEKSLTRLAARLKNEGRSQAEIDTELATTEWSEHMHKVGFTQDSTLDFLTSGKVVLCRILQHAPVQADNAPAVPGVAVPSFFSIDFRDEVKAVEVAEEEGPAGREYRGVVTKLEGLSMPRSLANSLDALFLLGEPASAAFSGPATHVRALPGGLELFSVPSSFNGDPTETQEVTVSVADGRIHEVHPVGRSAKFGPHYVATHFRKYGQDIWLPDNVTITRGSRVDRYTLVNFRYNQKVDPQDLLMPRGAAMVDYRFDSPVSYNFADAFPTDDFIRSQAVKLKADEIVGQAVMGAMQH